MRKRSRTKPEGGFVLTWKEISSPAWTDAREQYPSIHGERNRLSGSTRVRSRSQSRVPIRSFSVTMRFGYSATGLNRTPATNVTGRESAFKPPEASGAGGNVGRRFSPPHSPPQVVGVSVGVAVSV